jgi:undecaprenyl-diphosphatase
MFSAAVAFLVFISRGFLKKYRHTDLAVFRKIGFLVSPGNNRTMLLITFLGKHQFLIPANLILILYFLFVGNETWFSIRVAAIALSSLVLMILLKNLFRRRRPLAPLLDAARGLSFPSGHAIMAVTFYGLLIFIVNQTIDPGWFRAMITMLIGGLIVLIGFSRVYLRVHYTSDVIAGFIIGFLWLFISLKVLGNIENLVS